MDISFKTSIIHKIIFICWWFDRFPIQNQSSSILVSREWWINVQKPKNWIKFSSNKTNWKIYSPVHGYFLLDGFYSNPSQQAGSSLNPRQGNKYKQLIFIIFLNHKILLLFSMRVFQFKTVPRLNSWVNICLTKFMKGKCQFSNSILLAYQFFRCPYQLKSHWIEINSSIFIV